jgi:hypothetical protein
VLSSLAEAPGRANHPQRSKVALANIPPWLEKLTSSDVRHSDVVAWWGAIAATIALGWNILGHVRSNGHLKVQATYHADNMKPHLPPVLTVRVTNIGSKPVLVQGIAIQRKKGSVPTHHFFPCQIPKMLAPGDFFLQVLDRTGWLPVATETLYAWDSSGRHWRTARKELRRLLDQQSRLSHSA